MCKSIFAYKFLLYSLLLITFCIILPSCNSTYVQKPTGYFKIDFPKKEFKVFDMPGYPYTFEYPVYANVVKDSSFFGDATENPWWININFPQFNGTIFISYKIIGQYQLGKLINDAFTLTNKHSEKANSIDGSLIETPSNIHGMFFKIGGEAATANQFFLTDSTKNFLRGALYFNAAPNPDSLQPVNDFLVLDMNHIINTFHWK